MDKITIQKIMLRRLKYDTHPKWGASHTEEINLFKRFKTHMRGTKEVKKALEELYRMEFINRYMKTGEIHVSLNINKKQEIEEFLEE
jgi:transcriptional regulator of NAD metabolism